MNHKRILALSITSAMVLAACQQPAAVTAIGAPGITSVTASPSTVNAGQGTTITVVATPGTGGTITSVTTSLGSCVAASPAGTYTCAVTVNGGQAAGALPVSVTVTNNGTAPTNTATNNSLSLTINRPTGGGGGGGGGVVVPGAPTVSISNSGSGIVQIGATAGGTTTLKSVIVSVSKQGGAAVTFPIASAVGQTSINQPLDISSALATPGTYTVSVTAINSSDLPATASLSSSIVVTAPPINGGGNSPVNNGVFDKNNPITTADINTDNQYRYADIDQVLRNDTSGVVQNFRLRYVRGTFTLADVPVLTGLPGGANITYYLSNTVSNPSNVIQGKVNTNSLNQGQEYTIVARQSNPDGSQIEVGRFVFVPDNDGPQVPKIQPQSRLNPALTSAYGNYINRNFSQTLTNTRSLEDNPVPPNTNVVIPSNPQNNIVVPPSGFASLNYFALPVPQDFVGDPGDSNGLPLNAAGNYDLTKAIDLGNVTGNVNLTENYKVNVSTAAVAAGKVLGDGRYVIFAVAFDQLGNRNKIDFQSSYILNVDNTGPTGNLRVVDRGPLDINATGPLCTRVNIVLGRPDLAPTDVFTALQNQSLTYNGVAYTGVNYVSGCALVSGTISDLGVGFDSSNIQNLLPGTINAPQGAQIGNTGLTFGVTTRSTASLAVSVINLNTVSDGLQPFTIQATDLLGNMSILPAVNVFVDNAAPSNINVSVASQNGTDIFDAWQNVGISATAEDNVGSGPRTSSGSDGPTDSFTTNKNFTFYYGTEEPDFFQLSDSALKAQSQQKFLAYDNLLVQINQSAVENTSGSQLGGLFSSKASFNLPNPSNRNAEIDTETNKLNIWALVADKAGNAAASKTQIKVKPRSSNLPFITPDLQGLFGSTTVENGDNFPYKGFTVLNRNTNGNVPLRTIDQLPALGVTGPDALRAYGPNGFTPFPFPKLTDYRQLPLTGTPATGTGTNFYRLSVQNADNDGIAFNGNSNQNTGIGRVTFAYRLPDPIQAQDGVGALNLNGVNPFDYFFSLPYAYRTSGGTVVYGPVTATLPNTPADKNSGFATLAACKAAFDPYSVVCANKAANTPYPFGAKEGDFITLSTDARPKEGGGTYFPIIVSSPNEPEYNVERKGRFLYNLPSWSGGNLANGSAAVPTENRIKHIWNNIADVEKGPFEAFFDSSLSILQPQDDSGRPELPDNILFKRSAIGVFAYNNYGNVDIQVKGVTTGFTTLGK